MMLKNLLLVLCLLPSFSFANTYEGERYATTEGKVYSHLSGEYAIAASTASWSTYTIVMKGTGGQIAATSLTASSLTVTTISAFASPSLTALAASTTTLQANIDAINNVSLTSTQTFSGSTTFSSSTTFTSTVTVGVRAMGVALDYSKALRGGWSIVGSSYPVAVGTMSFTGFNPTYAHRVRMVGRGSGANWGPVLRFNGINTSTYSYLGSYLCQGGSLTGSGASSTDTISACSLTAANGCSAAGHTASVRFDIAVKPAEDDYHTAVMVESSFQYTQNTGATLAANLCNANFGGGLTHTSAFTSFQLGVNTGAFTGRVTVEAFVPSID
jgi:hypothetical protein